MKEVVANRPRGQDPTTGVVTKPDIHVPPGDPDWVFGFQESKAQGKMSHLIRATLGPWGPFPWAPWHIYTDMSSRDLGRLHHWLPTQQVPTCCQDEAVSSQDCGYDLTQDKERISRRVGPSHLHLPQLTVSPAGEEV